ncbi:MAG: response regulator [Pirellulales bacterium]|nr:response regulator [Pirellulales bacterium]
MYKLLIVDDDESSREVLKDALEGDDYEISMACDGREGLDKVRADLPDLVLLDIDMPRMDGVEVLKAIMADPKTQLIPVIMVTAVNADSQIAMSLNIGAVDHIVKPYSSTIVRARVRAALRSADAARSGASGLERQGTVVSFLGSKGGVGTTSIARNVAVHIARRGVSVILCELRCDGGTLAQELGLSAQYTLAGMMEDLTGPIRAKDVERCCFKQPNGLRAVISAHAPDQLCPMTETQAEQVVAGLVSLAEYVVCDLPSMTIPSTTAALRHSDLVLIVLDMEPIALHAAEVTYRRLRSLQISPSCIGAIISTKTIASASVTLKDVRETLECPLMGVIPHDPDAFVFAAMHGLPLIEAVPNSGAAGAITSLTKRIEEGKLLPLQF